jgi:putative transposase
MKKSRFTDSQIIAILTQNEAATTVPDLCREHSISCDIFYKWLINIECGSFFGQVN